MKIELMDCEEIILQEIREEKATRDDVVLTYAFCIDSDEYLNYGKINKAIIERWSRSALAYIKDRAGKLREGKIDV